MREKQGAAGDSHAMLSVLLCRYLRYIGGSPAKHVQQLKTGPHLEVGLGAIVVCQISGLVACRPVVSRQAPIRSLT